MGLREAIRPRDVWNEVRRAPLRALAIAFALVTLGGLLRVVFLRLRYPYEIEWMEGGVVGHIRTVLAGEPLYREPSVRFTPFIYTPFYYYVSAIVSRIVGVGLFAPRLVSALSSLGSMALIARLVRGEGGRPLAMLVGVAFFAASYSQSGFFMDLARVDALFVVIFLGGLTLLRQGRARWTAPLAGVLFFLAFLTKQTGLVLSMAVVVGAFPSERRRAVIAGVTFLLLTAVGIWAFDRASAGTFSWYVFTVPKAHGLRLAQWWSYLLDVGWRPLPIALLFGLVAFTGTLLTERRWLYLALCGSTFAAAYSSLLHEDGFANVTMPWHAALAIVGALGMETLLRQFEQPSRWRELVFGVVALQLGLLSYPPGHVLPRSADRRGGDRMIARLAAQPGPMLVLGSGHYASMAGHPEIHAHTMAIFDVLKSHDEERKAKVLADLHQTITSKRYASIVTDESFNLLPGSVLDDVRRTYRNVGPAFDAPKEGYPRIGYHSRPGDIWVAR